MHSPDNQIINTHTHARAGVYTHTHISTRIGSTCSEWEGGLFPEWEEFSNAGNAWEPEEHLDSAELTEAILNAQRPVSSRSEVTKRKFCLPESSEGESKRKRDTVDEAGDCAKGPDPEGVMRSDPEERCPLP